MQPLQEVEPPTNYWKGLTVLSLVVGLLPVGIALFAALVGVWIGLAMLRWMLGFRGASGGGTSLFDLLVLRRVGGGRAADKIPVRAYEIDAGAGGVVHLRQTGEFTVGSVMVGQEIEARVVWRQGEAQLVSGHNRSTNTPLRLASNPWPLGFVVVVVALGVLWMGVLPSLNGGAMGR